MDYDDENSIDSDISIESEICTDGKNLQIDHAEAEMQRLIPHVLNTMFECGKLESYLKFNRLIFSGNFPMNNICFLLFTDLIEWFSCQNTCNIKYQTETMQFWQIGYRLFQGKVLRFMSGLRNYGQVLNKNAERSELNPSDSRINFAVPAQKNLYRKEDKLLPIYPGIICDKHMQALAEKYSGMPLK